MSMQGCQQRELVSTQLEPTGEVGVAGSDLLASATRERFGPHELAVEFVSLDLFEHHGDGREGRRPGGLVDLLGARAADPGDAQDRRTAARRQLGRLLLPQLPEQLPHPLEVAPPRKTMTRVDQVIDGASDIATPGSLAGRIEEPGQRHQRIGAQLLGAPL